MNADETEDVGRQLARKIKDKKELSFVAMYGDLGAGKTAFVRGFASVLSPGSKVKSPTYTIVNEYRNGDVPLFHFDLYRVGSADEYEGFGFEEYLGKGNCIAEWSENLGSLLPPDAIKVMIEKLGDNVRKIKIEGISLNSEKLNEDIIA